MKSKDFFKIFYIFLAIFIFFSNFNLISYENNIKAQTSLCLMAEYGDADCTNKVDLNDFYKFKTEFINHSGLTSDFNKSSSVDLNDFMIWKRMFLESNSSSKTPRIRTRSTTNGAEFFNLKTESSFLGRGNNYIRLKEPAPNAWYHSTFDPGTYDLQKYKNTLIEMHGNGYNLLRVFFDENMTVNQDCTINDTFATSVSDFIKESHNQEIYVQLTFPNLPVPCYPEALSFDTVKYNHIYLTRSWVDSKKKWITDFIKVLKNKQTPMETIFSYNLENEYFMMANIWPYDLRSGNLTTANGKTYDMSSSAQRMLMYDENLLNFIKEMKAAIRLEDYGAMVTIGFFPPGANGNPNFLVRTQKVIIDKSLGGSDVDFADIHIYSSATSHFDDAMNKIGYSSTQINDKPLVLGEFGYVRGWGTVGEAAMHLKNIQIRSCNNYRMKGWLVWTWDTGYNTNEDASIYSVLDTGGAINGQLAPIVRQNPCQ